MPPSKLRVHPGWLVALTVVAALPIADGWRSHHRRMDTRSAPRAETARPLAATSANAAAAEADEAPPPRAAAAAEGQTSFQVSIAPVTDLDRTLYAALQITAADSRRRALRRVAEQLAAAGDTATSSDYVAALLGPDDRVGHGDAYTFTKIFAERLAARDPPAVVTWSQSLPDTLKEVAYPFVAREWAARDLSALEAWTRSIESAALRATVLRATGQQLRQLAADRAAAWARRLAESPDGARFSDLVVEHWARQSFSAAAGWAATLTDAADHAAAVLALASSAAAETPVTAASWAATLPEGDLRTRAVTRSLAAWAESDPAGAAKWCQTHARDAPILSAALPQIASAWLRRDHAAASRWIAHAPMSGETKTYLLSLSAEPTAVHR